MTQELRFDGRVAIVTGAGMGLGRAHAVELARRGAKVVVNDFKKEAADAVVGEIKAAGGQAVAAVASVASAAGAQQIVAAALDRFGGLDVLVNNAGTSVHGNFAEIPAGEYDRVIDTNLRGTWEVTRAAWPHLQKKRYGRVLMTASAAGLYGQPAGPQYSASKAADCGLALSLATEGEAWGIKVNVLAPAAFTPLSDGLLPDGEYKDWFRTLLPEAVSQLVVWLVHESCPVTAEVWGAMRGVVVRYAMASKALAMPEFRAEEISAKLSEFKDTRRGLAFDPNLHQHLAALAALNMGRATTDAFQIPEADRP
jgi:NAD(P)-dependent dehydrogenase (short-subunit alcohol dehydrogenase family)